MTRVSLFIPCLVDTLAPEVGEATARVLARLGLSLDYPAEQTCCGQPAFNAGHWDAAARVARRFMRAFADSETIVSPSGSCVSMVRNHFPRLFANSPSELSRALALGERTYELTEFMVGRLGVTDAGGLFEGRVTYHDSCHLKRELGIAAEPRALLSSVSGLELVEMEESDRCCGFGGTFSVRFPEVSSAMVARKAARIEETGARAVVMCDPGCLLNIRGYLRRSGSAVLALHVAEVLDRTE